MYTVAAFPSTTSPYLRPSPSARVLCRRAVGEVAALVSSLHTTDLDRLGPMFAFTVWATARSLVILWTTGYETTGYGATTPADLDPLLNCLRHMASTWPSAQRYADLIQLILDTKDNPGGPTGLEIFNDTRRTAYGLQHRLGTLAGCHVPDFDFLDIPLLDAADLGAPWGLSFGLEGESDWL